jgi:hypothetical protein
MRPYASPGNVTDVLQRYRSKNLPQRLETADILTAGVPEGNISRTRAALRFLGLIAEDETPTDEWRALCAAPDDEYRAQLADLLRKAYADVFGRIDPATGTQGRIVQAFQPFEPRSQIIRMVTFFLGMCVEAGIEPREPTRRRMTKNQAASVGAARARPTPRPASAAQSREAVIQPIPPPAAVVREGTPSPKPALHLVIAALLTDLESIGPEWTKVDRDRWFKTFEMNLDYAYPPKVEPPKALIRPVEGPDGADIRPSEGGVIVAADET